MPTLAPTLRKSDRQRLHQRILMLSELAASPSGFDKSANPTVIYP
jgi:hypothetical protein